MINKATLTQAVTLLRQGKLVSIPTETVYGLGADARHPDALRKIFLAKERPMDHPLIVHLADASQISEWARDVSVDALMLAKTYWPGPLTLIFKKADHVLDLVTGGQDTVGLRVPNHPVAHALLQAFGGGLAAPSANRFGRISPTTAEAVREELGDKVDLVLEGGSCEVGVESTIVDVSGAEPVILRPGMISRKEIEVVLGKTVLKNKKNAPRVSGSHESHYAPRTKTVLMASEKISEFLSELKEFPVALVARHSYLTLDKAYLHLMPGDAKNYAHDLYGVLRELDKKNFRLIVVEAVPEESEWDAIRDRLNRASS